MDMVSIQLKLNSEAIHMQRWGLLGIQERIELVRGRMSIQSDPQHGTTLIVNLPLIASAGKQDG